MVQIPAPKLRSNVGRFCHVKWAHPKAVWKIIGFRGSLVLLRTKKGKEITTGPEDIFYYRGFEDPW